MKTRTIFWSRLWNQPCLTRFKTFGTEKPVAKTNPILASEDIHASSKLTNHREAPGKDSTKKDHQDRIAGKGINFVESLRSCAQVQSCAPSNEQYQMQRAAVDKEWEKLEKMPAWHITESHSKKEVIQEAWKQGRTVHLATLMDTSHLQELGLGAEIPKIQRTCCAPG